jgi:hypothetical protein
MTAPTEKIGMYGLRFAVFYLLNTSNTPKAISTTAYEGIQAVGSVGLELEQPDSQRIDFNGEDGVTGSAFLGPKTAMGAKLSVEAGDPALIAMLDGTKIATIGEMSMLGLGTEKQGAEPQVGAMVYQAGKGLVTGAQYWHTYWLPSAQVTAKRDGAKDGKSVMVYNIASMRTTKYLWGPSYSIAVEGFLAAQWTESWSNYPHRLTSFVADGTAVDFVFPVSTPSNQTTGIQVYKNGVIVSTGLTLALDKITFSVAPTALDRIDVLREVAP